MGKDLLTPTVYILDRVARAMWDHCRDAAPDEAVGKIYGYRRSWSGERHVRVTDRATAPCDTGPAHGRFTPEATQACQRYVDDRYRGLPDRPRELGIYHSHPFGSEPHFSSTDRETFLSFPYDTPGNVFVLVDPTAAWFKVYVLDARDGSKRLLEVPWIEYRLRS